MKTLDEVIKANECCDHGEPDSNCDECPYGALGACCAERENDALHYLKTIETTENLYHDAVNELSKWKNEDWKDRYLPLTWDELKQMEGKPIWIEAESLSIGVSPYWVDWYIIESFSDDEFMHCNDGYEWAKETQGRLWQAYRKERE